MTFGNKGLGLITENHDQQVEHLLQNPSPEERKPCTTIGNY